MFWGVLEILWWCYVLRVSVLDVLMSCCLGTLESWSKDIFLERFCDSQHLSRKISTIIRKDFYNYQERFFNFQERDVVWFIFSMISEEVVWFSTMFRSGCMIFYNFHGKFLQFSEEVLWFSIIFRRGCMILYNFSEEVALFYIIFRRGCVILYLFSGEVAWFHIIFQ